MPCISHFPSMRTILAVVCIGLGAQLSVGAADPDPPKSPFEARIAPVLARHCLECHGPSSKKGGLDLSRKGTAFQGGKNGLAIVPRKPNESLVWEHVSAGRMPPKSRPPLTAEDTKQIESWLATGADWPAETEDITRFSPQRAGSPWVRRLTVPEYITTVRQTLGVDIATEAREWLPRDQRADGFSNTAYNLTIDLAHVEGYARLAGLIVQRVDLPKLMARFNPEPEVTQNAFKRSIAGLGQWVLRGPLTAQEIGNYLRITQAVQREGGDYHEAMGFVLEAMLQSPRFLYRMEQKKSPYALASRLSYIITGGPPDAALLEAATTGELDTQAGVERHVKRLLKDPQAVQQSLRFISEWMHLDRLETMRPDPKRFPKWDPQLAVDMRAETMAFFEEIAWKQQRPLADLLNAQVTFLTPRLAEHYGIPTAALSGQAEGKLPELVGRATADLQALYTFTHRSEDTIRDLSGHTDPINLQIDKPETVRWTDTGLQILKPTQIQTLQPPTRLIEAIRSSGEVTLEVWLTPARTHQVGPARIVTLSSGPSQRNITLGQEQTTYDVRLRQKGTDANGIPGFSSPTGMTATRPTHLVYTRDRNGEASLYVDGERKAQRTRAGDLTNWDQFLLAIGNETTGDRPWLGTLHLLAIYSRALSPKEILGNRQGLTRYDLARVSERGGLLTQASVLTMGGDDASMVTRGLFVLKELLNSGVDDPPPCVDTTPIPSKPGLSQRAIALQRINNEACSGCHQKFETIAFGLERFNGIGAYNTQDEYGNRLEDHGQILFPGRDKPVTFQSSAELMNLLAKSPPVQKTITRKVTQFALGRPIEVRDEPYLDQIHAHAQRNGGTYANTLAAIVLSDLVLGLEESPPKK